MNIFFPLVSGGISCPFPSRKPNLHFALRMKAFQSATPVLLLRTFYFLELFYPVHSFSSDTTILLLLAEVINEKKKKGTTAFWDHC